MTYFLVIPLYSALIEEKEEKAKVKETERERVIREIS